MTSTVINLVRVKRVSSMLQTYKLSFKLAVSPKRKMMTSVVNLVKVKSLFIDPYLNAMFQTVSSKRIMYLQREPNLSVTSS